MEEIIKKIINNLKNEKVKEECLELLNGKKEQVVEQTEKVVDQVVEETNEQGNKIKELLNRK